MSESDKPTAPDLEWPACPFCYGRGHKDAPDDGTTDWYCKFCGGDGHFEDKCGTVTLSTSLFKMLVLSGFQFHHPSAKERYIVEVES